MQIDQDTIALAVIITMALVAIFAYACGFAAGKREGIQDAIHAVCMITPLSSKTLDQVKSIAEDTNPATKPRR